jgi:hypothetical protein
VCSLDGCAPAWVGRAYTDGLLIGDDYDVIRTAVTRHDAPHR